MDKILFPFGYADSLAPAYAASQAIEIQNNMTYIKLTGLTGATELDLSAHAELRVGAKVLVDVVQDGTGRNVTMGSNVIAPALTGVANDRDTLELTWDGTEFIGGAWAKVVDAA